MAIEKENALSGKIKGIKVKSLFGLFDYDIPFNDCGVTILIGVNGSGKSTIFKILNNIFENNFHNILDMDFELFEINFENGNFIKCEKAILVKKQTDVSSYLSDNIDKSGSYASNNFKRTLRKLNIKSKLVRDFSITIKVNDLEVEHQFVCLLQRNEADGLENKYVYMIKPIADEIKDALDKIKISSCFIQTQRLQSNDTELNSQKYIGTRNYYVHETRNNRKNLGELETQINKSRIEECAKNLSENIKLKRSKYFAESQDIEKKILYEYLNKPINSFEGFNSESEIENIEKDISKVKSHIENLLKLGVYEPDEVTLISDSKLLDEKLIELKKFKKEILNNGTSSEYISNLLKYALNSLLLKSYSENMRQKLEIFEDLEIKLEAFANNLSIFNNKNIEINLEEGFIFKIDSGLNKGEIINPKDLSSGEQHEVILNYELIFNTENNLILIDEPEISLHILWQRKFIDNLLKISRANSLLNIMVATHSPDIILNHRKLVRVLNNIDSTEA